MPRLMTLVPREMVPTPAPWEMLFHFSRNGSIIPKFSSHSKAPRSRDNFTLNN